MTGNVVTMFLTDRKTDASHSSKFLDGTWVSTEKLNLVQSASLLFYILFHKVNVKR